MTAQCAHVLATCEVLSLCLNSLCRLWLLGWQLSSLWGTRSSRSGPKCLHEVGFYAGACMILASVQASWVSAAVHTRQLMTHPAAASSWLEAAGSWLGPEHGGLQQTFHSDAAMILSPARFVWFMILTWPERVFGCCMCVACAAWPHAVMVMHA